MEKENKKGAAEKTAALSAEEFQKLTPEQQLEYLKKLQDDNTALNSLTVKLENELNEAADDLDSVASENKKLKKLVKADTGKAKEKQLPSFEVDDDDENDITGGEYEFTCPTFTHGGKAFKAHQVVQEAEGKDLKKAVAAQGILSILVAKGSGIVKLKGQED